MTIRQVPEASYDRAIGVIVKAPASRRELFAILALGLGGLTLASVLALYVIATDAPVYWLYVAASLMVLASVSLCLFVWSYFKSVEFSATARGLIAELEVVAESVRGGIPGGKKGNYASIVELTSLARRYGDGSLASGNNEVGRHLIRLSSSIRRDALGWRSQQVEGISTLQAEAGEREPI